MKQHIAIFKFIVFGLLIFVKGGLYSQEKSTSAKMQGLELIDYYETKNYNGVIFPANLEKGTPVLFGQNRFTPTRFNVDTAEIGLVQWINNVDKSTIPNYNEFIKKKLNKYSRQYIGYLDSNNERILLINFIYSTDSHKKWRYEYIEVLDGGFYYWYIEFNLTKREFQNIKINGDA